MTGNDDFFGTTPTPPAATPVAPPRPGYATPQYGSVGAQALPPTSRSSMLPLVIGLLVAAMVGALAFAGYRVLFAGPRIEMPDTLLGLERMDTDDPSTDQLIDAAEQQLKSQIGDANVEVGLYRSANQFIFVLAGDFESGDVDDPSAFFSGMERGLASSGQAGTLKTVDPGSHGGEMRCLEVQSAATCAWIDEDTVGAFVIGPVAGDVGKTAVELRDSVEK